MATLRAPASGETVRRLALLWTLRYQALAATLVLGVSCHGNLTSGRQFECSVDQQCGEGWRCVQCGAKEGPTGVCVKTGETLSGGCNVGAGDPDVEDLAKPPDPSPDAADLIEILDTKYVETGSVAACQGNPLDCGTDPNHPVCCVVQGTAQCCQCAGDAACAAKGQTCFEGRCLNCHPGLADCESVSSARLCRLDGSGWDFTECGVLKCVGGLCAYCVPGFKKCEGTQVLQCQNDASTFTKVEDCDTSTTGRKCLLGACIQACDLNAKFHTNQGCEFWAIDMDNYHDNDPASDGQNSPYAIVVSNPDPDFPAIVTISQTDGQETQVAAPPLTATPIFLKAFNVAGPMKAKMARRVTSTLPIVAYQFNPLENVGVYSNDASLLLPTNVLGKHYMVMSWPTLPGTNDAGQILASNFAVVAAETTKTHVKVTVTAKTQGGGGLPVIAAGGKYETDIDPFDVLNFEASEPFGDLTGSTVDADGRVSVFGGHVCANAPISQCVTGKCSYDPSISCATSTDCPGISACDHMEEQIQPLAAWGMSYVVGRFWPRGSAPDVIRVLAAEDDTHVTVAGASVTVPVLSRGKFHEFEITSNVEITADKQILIGQFMEGQDAPGSAHNFCLDSTATAPCVTTTPSMCQCHSPGGLSTGTSCVDDSACSPNDANIGDPDFLIGVPIDQFRSDYVFLVPGKYSHSYINLVAEASAQITLDGNLLDPGNLHPVGSGAWSVARLPLGVGSHTVTSDRKVGISVYGWDRYVSYSYPGGMNVETLKAYP